MYVGLVALQFRSLITDIAAFSSVWSALPVLATAAVIIISGIGVNPPRRGRLPMDCLYTSATYCSPYLWHFVVIIIYSSVIAEFQ